MRWFVCRYYKVSDLRPLYRQVFPYMWPSHLCCCLLQGGASATSNSRENVMSAFSSSASPMSHGPASHSPQGRRGECSSTRGVREDTTTPAKCLIPSLSSPTLVSELSLSGKASYCRSPTCLTVFLVRLPLPLTHSLYLSFSLSPSSSPTPLTVVLPPLWFQICTYFWINWELKEKEFSSMYISVKRASFERTGPENWQLSCSPLTVQWRSSYGAKQIACTGRPGTEYGIW